MTTLAFLEPEFEGLVAKARSERLETAAVGFIHDATKDGGRILVRAFAPVPDGAYLAREPHRVTLSPEFCMDVANRARTLDCGIILAHTHPNGPDEFSAIDDMGEKPLADYFGRRVVGHRHFAAVVTPSLARCRGLGALDATEIEVIGATRRHLAPRSGVDGSVVAAEAQPRFDRQVRAFGAQAQALLSNLRVAIIGLGGTGSIVAHELAYLGVNDFTLIDPDTVDESNLNRLLGATAREVGLSKVEVASRSITALNPAARCETITSDVLDKNIAVRLLGTDFLFCCTDSHASRALLNQMAYQYLIPCIDMGVAIYAHEDVVTRVAGRVQMLAPGLPCLVCAKWLDSKQIRLEMMTPVQRHQDPYFIGHSVPHPAVISLNGTVASAAVTMFLSAVAKFPSEARMLIYDAIRGSLRPTTMTPDPHCVVCSLSGALARGVRWALPVRTHAVD